MNKIPLFDGVKEKTGSRFGGEEDNLILLGRI